MTRRKGERTTARNERDFPNIVELKISPNGLGAKLDLIHEFHREDESYVSAALRHPTSRWS